MSDVNLEPLYKKDTGSDDYICTVTGNKCYFVTKKLSEFKLFIKRLAEERKNQTFYTGDENLCDECCLYRNTVLKVTELAKDYMQKVK